MNAATPHRPSLGFIMLAAVMIAVIGVLLVLRGAVEPASSAALPERSERGRLALIDAEASVFQWPAMPENPKRRGRTGRTLAQFHSRRAYPGAPPEIPHKAARDMVRDAPDCLGCHLRGGYVSAYEAYAPLTPHPQWLSCRQCHVPRLETQLFVETRWRAAAWPVLNQREMPGAPPAIPHDLRMRGPCLACHGGPAAVREIATSHPDRINCRQCHVPLVEENPWRRQLASGDSR
jgi:cytochrome c-type protein NapB